VLCDHLGTVRDLIGNGIAAHFEYNAFGQLLSKTGNADSLFKYTGKITDSATELQWNINRWYDPKVGRWISEDPIGFMGKDMNIVRYVHNSSIINSDLKGLETCNLIISLQGPWTMHVSGFNASVTVGTNPGVNGFGPATSLYCYRSRIWNLGYKCPGSWNHCSAIISTSATEYQGITVAVPSSIIIFLGTVTIPIPTGLSGPGPGIAISDFLNSDEAQSAFNECNHPSIASFPASTYTPPPTYYRW
jgi:RHS repeat-associated protein